MNTKIKISKKQISRRKFLGIGAGVTFMVTSSLIVPKVLLGNKDENRSAHNDNELKVTAWVHLGTDGKITIYNPAAEMGQGSMTALAVIIAEEMDADWSNVHIEHSPVEADIFGAGWGGRGGGSMITVGSRTVASYFNMLRQAGAQARYVLLKNAAEKLSVPINELSTKPSYVIHSKSNRSLSYGEIASFAHEIADIPEITDAKLKNPDSFSLIGKIIPRFDIPEKVDGSAKYSIDIQVPGMVYGFISRSPVNGSKPNLLNEEDIRDMDGITDIIKLDHGIGIISNTVESGLKAKDTLQIQWNKGAKAETHTSEEAYNDYAEKADSQTSGDILTDEGDINSSLENGVKTYSVDYKNDYIYHAQMEPLNAVVSVARDGLSAEAWIGTQAPSSARSTVARTLGIDVSRVKFNRLYLGGGFGRRSNPDYVQEATLLSKAVKKPVKLIWTREDDIQYGMFRPMSLQRMQASIDKSGDITGWRHTIVGTGNRLLTSGASTNYYSFPNQRIELRGIDHGVRTKHWRAVGHGANKFAIEAFIDEIASDQHVDPLEFRLKLMSKYPRAQKVLRTAAEMANWGREVKDGRGKGIAFAERSSSLAACVCEISIDYESGKIKIHHIWASLDSGVVVQPDNVIAQMEGGLIMGLSSILMESITFKKGKVQQSNYDDYPIIRIADAPERIEVKLIPSTERPTGIGESAIPIIGGAIANAFGNLTGKRLRHLPFTPEKVLELLAS